MARRCYYHLIRQDEKQQGNLDVRSSRNVEEFFVGVDKISSVVVASRGRNSENEVRRKRTIALVHPQEIMPFANAANFRATRRIFSTIQRSEEAFSSGETRRFRWSATVLASIRKSRQHNGVVFQWQPFKFR